MNFEPLIFWFQGLPTWQKGVVAFLVADVLAILVWLLVSRVIPHFRERVKLKKEISWGKRSFWHRIKRNTPVTEDLFDHYIQTVRTTVVSQANDLLGDPGVSKSQNLVEAFEPEKIGPRFRILTWLVEARMERSLEHLEEVRDSQVPHIRDSDWFQRQETFYEDTLEGPVDQFYQSLWKHAFSSGIVGLHWILVAAPVSLYKRVRNAVFTPPNARLRWIHNRMRLFALVQERFIIQMKEATAPQETGNKESRVRFRVRMRIEDARKIKEERELKELLTQFAEAKRKLLEAIKYVATRQNKKALQYGEPSVTEGARHLQYAMLKPYFKQTLSELEEFEEKLRENLAASTQVQKEDLEDLFDNLLLGLERFSRRLQALDFSSKAEREVRERFAEEREHITQDAIEFARERSHVISKKLPSWAAQIRNTQDRFYKIHERFQQLEEEHEEFVAPKPLIQALRLFREDLPQLWANANENGFLNALSDVRIRTETLVESLQDYELWGERLIEVQERVDQIEALRHKLKEEYGEEVTQSQEWVTAWNSFVDGASSAFANADWEMLREEISSVENPLRKHEYKVQSALERVSRIVTDKSELVTEEDVTRAAGTRHARRRSSRRSDGETPSPKKGRATTDMGTQIPEELRETWEGTDKKKETEGEE